MNPDPKCRKCGKELSGIAYTIAKQGGDELCGGTLCYERDLKRKEPEEQSITNESIEAAVTRAILKAWIIVAGSAFLGLICGFTISRLLR